MHEALLRSLLRSAVAKDGRKRPMARLTLSHIDKSFGPVAVLKDISLAIEPGEFVCLLGASGCGKTTLLRLVAGLETPDGGTMRLETADLAAIPCHERGIGMVFQSLALFPHLTVGGNVAYGPRLRGASPAECEAEVVRLLAMVGLAGLEDRTVSALSGGQRQRVAIARALALRPALFLMDEPFSALDAALREQMQVEVRRLQRDLGVTTIFVTHDQREAMALADRIVVMNGGRIEQAASPDDIYARPASRFVAGFIGDNNILDIAFGEHGARLGDMPLPPPSGAFAQARGTHTLAIRPEAITLDPPGMERGPTGTVVSQRRLGAMLEREVALGSVTLRQNVFADRAGPFGEGDAVAVSWDWDRAHMLPS